MATNGAVTAGSGPSQVETFDPKPLLNELHGQPRPAEFGEAKYQFIQSDATLLGSQRRFRKCGESGIEVSDLFPHLRTCIDDCAVIRSCQGDQVVHSAAQYELFSGRTVPGFPSMGSWVTYGLGSESDNLPAFVVLPDPRGLPPGGIINWGAGFLPAEHQAVTFDINAKQPIADLFPPEGTKADDRAGLDFLQRLNHIHRTERSGNTELEARIQAYEMAARLQLGHDDANARVRLAPDHNLRPARRGVQLGGRVGRNPMRFARTRVAWIQEDGLTARQRFQPPPVARRNVIETNHRHGAPQPIAPR